MCLTSDNLQGLNPGFSAQWLFTYLFIFSSQWFLSFLWWQRERENLNVLMYRETELMLVTWIHVCLSVLDALSLFWLILLMETKNGLLEIFSMALHSLFQQRKRKILLELTFAFLLNHAWISSERVKDREPLKATEHLFFPGACY